MPGQARCCSANLWIRHCLILVSVTLSLIFFSTAILVDAQAAVNSKQNLPDTDFPIYPTIKPNVDFWIRIFTKTSKSQGLLHDTKNLAIIYDTVNLDASATSRAQKKNKRIKKKAIAKYKTILLTLAKGKTPATKEEKRVARLFGPNPKPRAFKNAAYRLRIQTGVKEEFRGSLIRSGAFIDEFRRIFRSYGLPEDLVYLPCVESSYRYKAYSKFGAAGIWQFTRSTGKRFMKVGYVVDERRDPYISTVAAAKLLKKNYGALREWPLAITAYNHGLNGMMRAKKSKGSYEKIVKSYRSRSFKFASKNFYSEFLAARIVGKNYKTYFGELSFDKPKSFQVVKTKGFLPITEISDKLGVSMAELQALNPGLRKPVFNGQKYIPEKFELKLPNTISKKTAHNKLSALYRGKQKPSHFHRVQKGDTAGAIARLHSVSLSDLILANGLSRRATIYVGQNLRIPVKGEIIVASQTTVKKTPKPIVKKKSIVKAKPILAKEKALKSPPPPKVSEVIAEAPAIEQKNETPINPNIVTSNLKVLKTYMKSGKTIGTIKIEAEETLGHYADWLGIKTNTIRRLNNLKYGTPIAIDQTIKLPMNNKNIQAFEEQRYEFHKEMEEDFFESFAIQTIEVYVIKEGDNIWNLCLNELEIPFWLLKKYNPNARFQTLMPGQKLKYPLVIKRRET